MRSGICFQEYEIVEFDVVKVFGSSVDAVLFFIKLSTYSSQTDHSHHTDKSHHTDNYQYADNYHHSDKPLHTDFCNVRSIDDVHQVKAILRYKNGSVYVNSTAELEAFDGWCCFEWR